MNPGARQEVIPASSFNLNPEPWKPVSSFSQFVEVDSAMMKPMLMDVHGKAQLLLVSFIKLVNGFFVISSLIYMNLVIG